MIICYLCVPIDSVYVRLLDFIAHTYDWILTIQPHKRYVVLGWAGVG